MTHDCEHERDWGQTKTNVEDLKKAVFGNGDKKPIREHIAEISQQTTMILDLIHNQSDKLDSVCNNFSNIRKSVQGIEIAQEDMDKWRTKHEAKIKEDAEKLKLENEKKLKAAKEEADRKIDLRNTKQMFYLKVFVVGISLLNLLPVILEWIK